MTCSTLLATHRTHKFSDTLLAFFHSRRHYEHNTNIWSQTHRWYSLINSLSAELDTPSVKRTATLTSELAIIGLAQDVANELLYGGLTYLFIKFLKTFLKVWLNCLPAMTSACILKDTLRNDTQMFLKFRDSIFEICLHLINSNFTSYFLTHRCWAAAREHQRKSRFMKVDYHYPQYCSLFLFYFSNSVARSKNYLFFFLNSTCPLKFRLIRWIPICSLWNKYPMSPIRNGIILRISSTRLKYRTLMQRECPQFPRSHPQNPKSWPSMTNPTTQQNHMDLDGSSRSFRRAWTTSTCRPIHLTFWQQWPW